MAGIPLGMSVERFQHVLSGYRWTSKLSFETVPPADAGRVMLAMQTYAKTLSAGFQTAAFYGGLEPAARIPQADIFQAMYRGPWAFEAHAWVMCRCPTCKVMKT